MKPPILQAPDCPCPPDGPVPECAEHGAAEETFVLTPLTHRLMCAAVSLNDDELAVLCEVADGLKMGQASYGKLEIGRDTRLFEDDILAEVRDGLAYAGIRLVQLRRVRKERGE